MPYFTYILLSHKSGDIYVGSTGNLQERIKRHNLGQVKSTKAYRPWSLLEYQMFDSRSQAVKQEIFLKNHQQKEIIKIKYNL